MSAPFTKAVLSITTSSGAVAFTWGSPALSQEQHAVIEIAANTAAEVFLKLFIFRESKELSRVIPASYADIVYARQQAASVLREENAPDRQ